MHRLIYVSTAKQLLNTDELVEILTKAKEKNSRLGITGMLLYKEGNFMQLLEGEEKIVRDLYETIRLDVRHHDAIILLDEPAEDRLFADWSMGFKDLSDPELESLPGYAPFRNLTLSKSGLGSDAGVCLDILRFFKESR
jgi:hypothetical protein